MTLRGWSRGVFGLALVAISAGAGGALTTMSVEDTLRFRTVREVRLSPSGERVAFVLREPNLAGRRNDDRVALLDVSDRSVRFLATVEGISSLVWDHNGRGLYALDRQQTRHRILHIDVGRPGFSIVWETDERIECVALSPDGSSLVVGTLSGQGPEEIRDIHAFGLVYEWGRHSYRTVTEPGHVMPVRVRLLAISTANLLVREVGSYPFGGRPSRDYITAIKVSPDNRRYALQLVRPGFPTRGGAPSNYDLAIVDAATGRWEDVMPGSIATETGATWLADSSELLFWSGGSSLQGWIYRAGEPLRPLPWLKLSERTISSTAFDSKTRMVLAFQRSSLARISLAEQSMTETRGILAEPSFDTSHSLYAFLSESSQEPPEIALATVGSAAPALRLTTLNPELSAHSLGRVEKLTVRNSYGSSSEGYLVYPVNHDPSRRYPLIIGTYGFRGRFLVTAEWHTTLPVQTLAGQGYAVILLNAPALPSAQVTAGNPPRARENEGWQVLSTIEAAVTQLVGQGVADAKRVGLYGWSYGNFVVEFTLAHSSYRFAAACAGEGGDYNPGEYWLFGTPSWPDIFDNTFGGPLNSDTVAAYLEFSPSLNAAKVNTPLLLEYMRENAVLGFEFFVPLKRLGIPCELVAYSNEEHNFVRPTTRFASMHRKVDWFNYWMLGKEDPDPAKAEQYARWRKMKTEWETAKSASGAGN